MNRKTVVLILIAFIAIVAVLYEQVTINKDTGQTIINMPNQKPENGSGVKQVAVLGSSKFITAGMTEAQLALAENIIATYVNSQLHGQYTQVSILNAGFKSTGNQLSAKMRLGSSSILLNLVINYSDLTNVEVIISSSSNNVYYHYDSGAQQTSS
jgi:hypothetical protein